MDETAALHDAEAGRLLGIAYRMLGSAADAEDAVQEAFARWVGADPGQVREPAAWLTTVLTRICVDRLRSAQRQREDYPGPWLPEPVDADAVDPAERAGVVDAVGYALLVVMEALTPAERAAFVLHDVLGHPYDLVARALDRSPAAARQLASRARRRLAERRPRPEGDPQRRRAVVAAFLEACDGNDVDAMLELLAPDAVLVGDGGGVVPATPAPLRGAERVAAAVAGLWRTGRRRGLTGEPAEVVGDPGVVVRADGAVETVMAFDVAEGRVSAIYAVRNPAKLAAFGAQRSLKTWSEPE